MPRETRIGIFVLAALAVMAYFIIRSGEEEGEGWFWNRQPMQTLHLELDDASGIREGTPVKVAGVKVGRVTGVRLESGVARADILVRADLALGREPGVEVATEGVLGDKVVKLVPSGEAGSVSPGTVLKGTTGSDLADLMDTLTRIGDEMLIITRNLRMSTELDSGGNRLDLIAANLQKLSESLVMAVEENRANLAQSMGNVRGMSDELRKSVPELIEEMQAVVAEFRSVLSENRGQAHETMNHVQSMSEKMDHTMSSIQSVANKVDEGRGTIGKLVNDDQTADKVDHLLDQMSDSLDEVKGFFNKMNVVQLDLGFDTEYLERHGATKGAFRLRLSPSDDKYYLIEAFSRDVDYLPIEFTQSTETTYDSDGQVIQTTVVETPVEMDDFGFGGQLAYRFGDWFVRGGLIEGEAGGGLDFLFLQDRANLTMEAYDFNRPQDLSGHFRLGFQYQSPSGLRFKVGADDVLESDLVSAYIGVGLSWKDEDIKTLIGTVGSAL